MKPKIQIEQLNEKHIPAAVDLIISCYIEEQAALPFLPNAKEFIYPLQKLIRDLFDSRSGVAAICDGELIGFLSGFQVSELFGKCKGIYSPLYGHGAKKEYRKLVYQELYKHAAEIWLKNDYMTHSLTFFAHDRETIDTWFWLGFGLRCIDSIRKVEPIVLSSPHITIKKVSLSEVPVLADIHRQHHMYYKDSPLFMPRKDEDPIQDLTQWLSKDNHHLWAAFQEDKPMGYMKIQPSGESFISEHQAVMNITGAYVMESERKAGIGAMILGEIQAWLMKNGYPLCGVDFESFNTTGSRFWNKYFTPYTYGMVRRIDERIER